MTIHSSDARPGLRVRRFSPVENDTTEYLLLDRAPRGANSWWLQDAETGEIGESESLDFLIALRDDYRPTDFVMVKGEARPVRDRSGDWAMTRSTERGRRTFWEIVHVPSGLRASSSSGLGYFPTIGKAKAALGRLADLEIVLEGEVGKRKIAGDGAARLREALSSS